MDSRSSGDAPARYARPNAVRTIGLAMPMSGRALVGRVLDDGLDHDDVHVVAQTERHRAAGVPSQFQHQRPGKLANCELSKQRIHQPSACTPRSGSAPRTGRTSGSREG